MANIDLPRGFEPHGKIVRANVYQSGSACYPGDIVSLASDGQVDPASADTAVLGICLTYASASGQDVVVADSPDQLISAQADETEIDAQTDIGQGVDLLATAGNSTYKASRHELDSSSIGTGVTFIILGIERMVGNALGTNAKVVCKINEHQLAHGTGVSAI